MIPMPVIQDTVSEVRYNTENLFHHASKDLPNIGPVECDRETLIQSIDQLTKNLDCIIWQAQRNSKALKALKTILQY